ncbi:MAG: hypothetical protein WA831_01200 [Methylovirgula sp.]
MLLARRFPAAAILPIASAFFILLSSAFGAPAEAASGSCEDAAGLSVLPAPLAPWKGAPLRVLVAAEKPLQGELSLIAPDGSVAAKSSGRQGGPPYFWFAEVASPTAGTWHATLALVDAPAECGTVTREIVVRDDAPPPPRASPGSVWPLRNTWNRAMENLFSAWIQKLFDGPLDTELSWPTLQDVLRDRSRNMLYDYMGLREDEIGIVFHPDCAKLPYMLRAYFAFKMGLPFGYSHCSRGNEGRPPKCSQWFNTANAGAGQAGLAASFRHFLPMLADAIQSGNGRTSASDNNTDFYPVPLTQETLRPGTIYADPYGHILMLVRRVPQAGGTAGIFLAVDAEPDGTVTRKRFWRGNFLFVHDPALGSPGFKRFRPVVRAQSGVLRRLTNAEIAKDPQYGDYSLEQSRLGAEDFYDRMDEVMSPAPLDPVRALEDAITSLEEQVKTRVTAVENGRKYQNSAHDDAAMPDGRSIFETNGAWEDFATPARDFRVLIAIDVVQGFPDHVARHPERYAIPQGKSVADVKSELESVLASELAARKFTYTRSDGSAWTLSLRDVVDRAAALEMAYNLNDCAELRWGAPEGSEEASTCKRHAPQAQRVKMSEYRAWFHERHWPTHD